MHRIFLTLLSIFPLISIELNAQLSIQPDTQQADPGGLTLKAAQPTIPPPPAPPQPAASKNKGYTYTIDGLPIFGSQLFQGDFKNLSFNGFNPEYQIGIGDIIQIMVWGALESNIDLTVDAQGNIFIPKVGPLAVLGVRNADINKLINEQIRKVYKENIDAYANLKSTQTVKVFASGFVVKPGLYQGFPSDSVLYFLDRASGIDPERGSYLNITLLRQGKPIAAVNLYDFLEKGTLPITQFRDGDVILVGSRGNTITIQGDVINPGRFEFAGTQAPLDRLLALAAPNPESTNISIRRSRSGSSQAFAFPLTDAPNHPVESGDIIQVSNHNISKNILVTITGEHAGEQNIVLPYGAVLSQALDKIVISPQSNLKALQVYRKSVAERQRTLLNQSLDNLERNVYSVKSASFDEAKLRQVEAEMTLDFIKRARMVQPKGQVFLETLDKANQLPLEDGDILCIPTKSSLVNISGEVKFPNTQTYRTRDSISDYIERAGGFTPGANTKELIIIRTNGAIDSIGRGYSANLNPGDEIVVLPKPDTKSLLYAKDITTILYQIAIAARVAIRL